MMALVVLVLIVVARLVFSRYRRRQAGYRANLAHTQPLTEWSARFPKGAQRRRRHTGGWGF